MAEANSTGSYKWDVLKDMPTKRVFSTPIEVDGKIYVVGGCDQRGTPLDCLEVYNPEASEKKKWGRLANMPTKRAAVCCVVVGKKIVAMGGVAVNQEPLDCVEVYDTEQKKWESKDSLKDKLLGLSGVCHDGKAIIVGGMSIDTNPKDYLFSYDLESDRWQSLPTMPTPRYATFSFLINDKLYVIGGRQGKLPCTAFEVYDFSTKKWKKLPNVPTQRVFTLYTHSDTHIFSVGGLNKDPKLGFSDAAESFDLEKEEWFIGSPMPTKRGDFAIGFLGGKVIAAGGLGNQGKPLAETEAYDLATNSWSSLGEIPTPHCSCAYLAFQGKLHVIGGLSTNGPSGSVESLKLL